MLKREVEKFLMERKGFLKKSPIVTAKRMWQLSSKNVPKNKTELEKELELIKNVQQNLRKAVTLESTEFQDKLLETYQKVIDEKNRPKKILLLDCEVSPNIALVWKTGYKLNINPEAIVKERAIICISFKFLGEEKAKSLWWDNGDDKKMLEKFSKIVASSDIVVTQNGDKFDLPWLRTRCLFHGIEFPSKINSLDTLKFARNNFYFNSNKLNYLGSYLGVGEKIHTSHDLWTKITLNNDKEALKEMVRYCEGDINLLEKVYNKLKDYVPKKKFEK